MNADVKLSRALEHPKLDMDTCLGAPLAQFETHAAVRRFPEMAPSYRIAGASTAHWLWGTRPNCRACDASLIEVTVHYHPRPTQRRRTCRLSSMNIATNISA